MDKMFYFQRIYLITDINLYWPNKYLQFKQVLSWVNLSGTNLLRPEKIIFYFSKKNRI